MPYKDPELQRAYQAARYQRESKLIKEIILEAKKGGCIKCDEIEPACLDFHHVDPKTKSFSIGTTAGGHGPRKISSMRDEIKKCVVLCRNCHAKLHAGLWSL